MTYHAVLNGVEGLERPMENYSMNFQVTRKWAKEMSVRYPDGVVNMYKVCEVGKECWRNGKREEIRP